MELFWVCRRAATPWTAMPTAPRYCGLGLGIDGLAGFFAGASALAMHFVMKVLRAAPCSF
jgi:hypothetical protein